MKTTKTTKTTKRGATKAKTAAKQAAPGKQAASRKTAAATREQTFTIEANDAMSVVLAGDFTDWQNAPKPMKRSGNGLWKVSVNLKPGTYHYRFIVDGQWRDDPQCTVRVSNPYGGQDAVREVG